MVEKRLYRNNIKAKVTKIKKILIVSRPRLNKLIAIKLAGQPERLAQVQVNLDMTDSVGPGKLVRHMQNLSYTYDTYLICMGQVLAV